MARNGVDETSKARQALLKSLSETVAASGGAIVLDRGTMMYLGQSRQASLVSLSILQAASAHPTSDATSSADDAGEGADSKADSHNAKLRVLSLMPSETEQIRTGSGWHGSRPAPVPRHLVLAAVAEAKDKMQRAKLRHKATSALAGTPIRAAGTRLKAAGTRRTTSGLQSRRSRAVGGHRQHQQSNRLRAPLVGSGSRAALAQIMSIHDKASDGPGNGDGGGGGKGMRPGLSQYMQSFAASHQTIGAVPVRGAGVSSAASAGGFSRLGNDSFGVVLGLEKVGIARVTESGESGSDSGSEDSSSSGLVTSRGSSATRVSLVDDGLGLAAHLALENVTSAGVKAHFSLGKIGVQRTMEVLHRGLDKDAGEVRQRAKEKEAANLAIQQRCLQSERLRRLRDGDAMALVECVEIEAAAACPRKLPDWAPPRVRAAAVQLQAGSSSIPLVETRLQFLSKLTKAQSRGSRGVQPDEAASAAAWAERTAVDPATSSLVLRSTSGESSRVGDQQASGSLGFNVDRFRATNHPVPDRDVRRWCELLSRPPIDRHDAELDALNTELGSSVAILEHLSPLLRRRFFRYATVVSAAPGDVLFEQGDPGNAVFVILRGLVAVQLAQASTRDSSDVAKISAKNLTRVYRLRHGTILRRKRMRAAQKLHAASQMLASGAGGRGAAPAGAVDATWHSKEVAVGPEQHENGSTGTSHAAEVWAESTRGLREKLRREDDESTGPRPGRASARDAYQEASIKVQQGKLERGVLDSLQQAVNEAEKQGRKLLETQGIGIDEAWDHAGEELPKQGEAGGDTAAMRCDKEKTNTTKAGGRRASRGDNLEAALAGRGVAPRRIRGARPRRASHASQASSQPSVLSAARLDVAKRRRRMSIDSAISLSTDSSESSSEDDQGAAGSDRAGPAPAADTASPGRATRRGDRAGVTSRVPEASAGRRSVADSPVPDPAASPQAPATPEAEAPAVLQSARPQPRVNGRHSSEGGEGAGRNGQKAGEAGGMGSGAPSPCTDIEADEAVLNTIAVLGPTTSFGEKGVVSSDRVRKASIAATEPTILLRVRGAILRSLVRENRRRQQAIVSLALRRSKVFAAFPDSAVHYLADAAQSLRFKPGQRIVGQGDELSGLWVINQGEASLARKILAPPLLVDGMRRLQHLRDVIKPDAPSQGALDDLRSRGGAQPERPAHFKKLPKPPQRQAGSAAKSAAAAGAVETAATPRSARGSQRAGASPDRREMPLVLHSRDALADLLLQSAAAKKKADDAAAAATEELKQELEAARAKRKADEASATVVGAFKAAVDVGSAHGTHLARPSMSILTMTDSASATATSPRSLASPAHSSPRGGAHYQSILLRAASTGKDQVTRAGGKSHEPAAGHVGKAAAVSEQPVPAAAVKTSVPLRTSLSPATAAEMAPTEPLDVPLKPLRPGDVVGFVDLLAIYAAVSLPPPCGPNLSMGKGDHLRARAGAGAFAIGSNMREAKAAVRLRRNMDWSAVTSSFTAEPEPGTPVPVEVIFLPRAAVLEVAALFPDAVWQSLSTEAEGLPDDAALRSLVTQRFIWECFSLDKATALGKVRGRTHRPQESAKEAASAGAGPGGRGLGSASRGALTHGILQPRWQPVARAAMADLRCRCNKLTPLLSDDPSLGVGMSEGGLFHSLAANERSAKEPTVSVQSMSSSAVGGTTRVLPRRPAAGARPCGAGGRAAALAKAGTAGGKLVLPPQHLRIRTAAVVGGIRALLEGKMSAAEAAQSMSEHGVQALTREARKREVERAARIQAGSGGAGSEWLGQWREAQAANDGSGSVLSAVDSDVLSRAVQAAVGKPAQGDAGGVGPEGGGLSFHALVSATKWLKETDGVDDSTLAAVITSMKAESDRKRDVRTAALLAASRAAEGDAEVDSSPINHPGPGAGVDLVDGATEQLAAVRGRAIAGGAKTSKPSMLLAVLQRATTRAQSGPSIGKGAATAAEEDAGVGSPRSRVQQLVAEAAPAAEQADVSKPGTMANAAAAYVGRAIDPMEAAAADTELRLWAGLAATQTTLATAAGALTARALAEAAESMFAHVSVARSESTLQRQAEFAPVGPPDTAAGPSWRGVGEAPGARGQQPGVRLIPGPRLPAHTILRRLQSSAISHTVSEAATEAAARVSLSRDSAERTFPAATSGLAAPAAGTGAGCTAMSALEGKIEEMPLPLFAVPREVRKMAQLRQDIQLDDDAATAARQEVDRSAAAAGQAVPSTVLRAARAGARGEVWGRAKPGGRGAVRGLRQRSRGHLAAAGEALVRGTRFDRGTGSSSASGSLSARN